MNLRSPSARVALFLDLALAVAMAGGCDGRGRSVVVIEVEGAQNLAPAWSSARLAVRGTYSDTSIGDVTPKATWRTSDPAVATVDPDGTLHAVRRGRATVTATVDGLEASAAVEVAAFRQVAVSPLMLASDPEFDAVAIDSTGRVTVVGAAWVETGGPHVLSAPQLTTSPPWYPPPAWSLAAARGTAASPPAWDPGLATTTPGPALAATSTDVALAMNGAGQAAFVFVTDTQAGAGALAFLDDGGWRWVRAVRPRETAVAVDDAGVVFAAHPGPATGAAAVLQVERLAAAGLLDVTEFPEAPGGRPVLSTAAGRTMVLSPGAGTRVFDGTGWGALAPLTAALVEPRLALRDDGSADLVDRASDSLTHRRFDGAAWGDPVVLTTSMTQAAVAFGPAGTLVVAYDAPGLSAPGAAVTRPRLLLRRFDGATWGAPVEVTDDLPPGRPLTVVTDGAGRWAVLWTSWWGLAVWASVFDGTTPVVQSLRGDPYSSSASLGAAAYRPGGDLIVVHGGVATTFSFQP